MGIRSLAVLLVSLATVVLTACDAVSVLAPAPDLEGTYAGEWIVRVRSSQASFERTFRCSGGLSIRHATTSSLAGDYRVGTATGCGTPAPVRGSLVDSSIREGGVSFRLGGNAGNVLRALTGCDLVGTSPRLSGHASRETVRVDAPVDLDCGFEHPTRATLSFDGGRLDNDRGFF